MDERRGIGGVLRGAQGRLEAFGTWRRELTEELVRLPATLRQLREGATNFELVSKRLADSSEALEEITRVYRSTMGESTRRSAELAELMRSQLDGLSGESPDVVTGALTEVQRGFEALAELNPFWVKRKAAD